jgi:hypothetical protein
MARALLIACSSGVVGIHTDLDVFEYYEQRLSLFGGNALKKASTTPQHALRELSDLVRYFLQCREFGYAAEALFLKALAYEKKGDIVSYENCALKAISYAPLSSAFDHLLCDYVENSPEKIPHLWKFISERLYREKHHSDFVRSYLFARRGAYEVLQGNLSDATQIYNDLLSMRTPLFFPIDFLFLLFLSGQDGLVTRYVIHMDERSDPGPPVRLFREWRYCRPACLVRTWVIRGHSLEQVKRFVSFVRESCSENRLANTMEKWSEELIAGFPEGLRVWSHLVGNPHHICYGGCKRLVPSKLSA